MRSLKFETPRAPQQPRTAEQKATPTRSSPGIVPPTPKAPKGDGFEPTRLPGRMGGGSAFDPSSGSGGTKASLSYIGASGTKGQPSGLTQQVRDQLDSAAVDIVSRLPDLTQGQFKQAVKSAVDSLNLGSRSLKHQARRYLLGQISKLSSGSGASGTKPFGSELYAARPSDSRLTPTTGTGSAPSTGTSGTLTPHQPILTKVARKLASDPKLQTDAQARKAAWAEIKKLGLGEAASQEARSFVLDQLATLRRSR